MPISEGVIILRMVEVCTFPKSSTVRVYEEFWIYLYSGFKVVKCSENIKNSNELNFAIKAFCIAVQRQKLDIRTTQYQKLL